MRILTQSTIFSENTEEDAPLIFIIILYMYNHTHSFFLLIEMKSKKYLLPILGVFLFLSVTGIIAGAISIVQKFPAYANPSVSTAIPFAVSLNTVGGKAYYATISLSAQTGLSATSNVTAYPSSGTSTSNVTIPISITVSASSPGVYQLNITVTEYNSSTAPQSVLAVQKYTTYVYVISPTSFIPIIVQSTTNSMSQSITLTAPSSSVAWYIKLKVLYPNATIAPSLFAFQALSSTPVVNVTVKPSTTTGIGNATITFNVSETNNLKFGEIPVTIIVYQYINGTNALYSVHVLHFNFFNIPPNVKGILAQSFRNVTVLGHLKFGNISIQNSNIPAEILGISTSGNSVSILFNDSFTGIISFYSNESPVEVIADGHPLQEYFTVPSALPLGGWTYYNGQVYVYADPSNVTAIYPTSTTTTTTATMATTTSYASASNIISSAESFYQQHKDLVIITLVFIFIIIIAFLLTRKQ